MRSRYEVEDRKNVYKSRGKRSLRGRLVENFVRGRQDDLDIFGNERPAFDIFYEFRLDFVGEGFANARVVFDVGPLRDQEEALRVLGVPAQHTVLHLCPRPGHGVAVGIVELLEQTDEFVLFAFSDAKIVDVQKVAFRCEGLLRHGVLLPVNRYDGPMMNSLKQLRGRKHDQFARSLLEMQRWQLRDLHSRCNDNDISALRAQVTARRSRRKRSAPLRGSRRSIAAWVRRQIGTARASSARPARVSLSRRL